MIHIEQDCTLVQGYLNTEQVHLMRTNCKLKSHALNIYATSCDYRIYPKTCRICIQTSRAVYVVYALQTIYDTPASYLRRYTTTRGSLTHGCTSFVGRIRTCRNSCTLDPSSLGVVIPRALCVAESDVGALLISVVPSFVLGSSMCHPRDVVITVL